MLDRAVIGAALDSAIAGCREAADDALDAGDYVLAQKIAFVGHALNALAADMHPITESDIRRLLVEMDPDVKCFHWITEPLESIVDTDDRAR